MPNDPLTSAYRPRGAKQAAIVQAVRDWITSGQVRPGERLPSYVEMQERFGVTPVTMKRAMARLKEAGLVVTRGPSGTFVAEHPPFLHQYGLVFPKRRDDAEWSTAYTALREAGEALHRPPELSIDSYAVGPAGSTPPTGAEAERFLRELGMERFAGLVFAEYPQSTSIWPAVEETHVPSVALMSQPRPGIPSVYYDYASFWDLAYARLRAGGCRRVAVLVLSARSPGDIESLTAAAAAHGLELPTRHIQSVAPRQPEWAATALELLLHEKPETRPDGLIISDDHLLAAGTAALADLGVSVPEELKVIGHWNVGPVPPSAAAVDLLGFDFRRLLGTALELLDRRRRREPSPEQELVPAAWLRPSESPGPLPAGQTG